ncbi:MAG TPA: PAS domain-containing sensor histidine kinase [Bacteroidales bacterium]|nr:PAS domain-containing sensor histidine kinase [Bacteroidales bacterium]
MQKKNQTIPDSAAAAFGNTIDHSSIFLELFRKSPTPYFLVNATGIINDLNKSGAKLLGISDDQEVHPIITTFITENSKTSFDHFLRSVFSTGNLEQCQVVIKSEKSPETMVKIQGLVSQEKQIAFLTVVNVTQQEQLEGMVYRERLLLRTLIDNLPDTLYIKDDKGRKVIVNPADVRVMGYSREEEVIGKNDLEIFTDSDIGRRGYEDDMLVLTTGKPILGREEDFYDADGKQSWLLTSKIPIRDEKGTIIGLVGIGRDITVRKQALKTLALQTEQLIELNATKDKFFSIIAHDLRSPLGTIISLIDMMLEDLNDFDKTEIDKFMRMIRASSNQLFSLLENLLLWARNQRGTITFQPEIIDLQKNIHDNINMVRGQAEKKEITLSAKIPGHIILLADKNMLDTILRNLLSNAIKYTPLKGRVEVTAKSAGQYAEITIRDSGIGISKENLAKLFTIAGKPSSPGTENEKGSGLGLILCREFVEKHQGTIRAESEPGQGSAFTFTIPVAL